MNIYIYGSTHFSNEIHKILDHGNIRFKIEDGEVTDIATLQQLQSQIIEDPYQIYLIDENKIIEDDYISKYFKFLIPKDGIEKTFLDQYGIGDVSTRTYKDLMIYIEKRIETAIKKPKASQINSVDDIFDAFDYDENKSNIAKAE